MCLDCGMTLFWQNLLKAEKPLFLGFHWYEYVFWLFKVTLKMVTEPL